MNEDEEKRNLLIILATTFLRTYWHHEQQQALIPSSDSMSSRPISPPPLKRRRISPPRPAPKTPETASQSLHHRRAPPPSPCPLKRRRLSPAPTPPTSPLTIYTWNINGLAPFLPSKPSRPITSFFAASSCSSPQQPPHHPSLRASLRRWSYPHILCLQETKLAPHDFSAQSSLRRTINSPLDDEDDSKDRAQYDVWFCVPKDEFNATGFGRRIYGVAVLVRRDVVRDEEVKVREVEWDLEGRVLVVELVQSKMCVIGVYAVNGTSNAYRNHSTGAVVGTRHERKRVFHRLLRQEVEGYEKRGWSVVVAGDMNIARSALDASPTLRTQPEHVANRAHFEAHFMQSRELGGLGMVDTFRELRGLERKFTWRPRGREWGSGGDRVDLVLVSRGLRGGLVEADILDKEGERGPSDHVPLFVMVELGKVGGGRGDGCGGRV